MVSAHELDASVGDIFMRVVGADEIVVLDFEPVLLPRAGLRNHVQKRQVAI
jgi:hypothetical protein